MMFIVIIFIRFTIVRVLIIYIIGLIFGFRVLFLGRNYFYLSFFYGFISCSIRYCISNRVISNFISIYFSSYLNIICYISIHIIFCRSSCLFVCFSYFYFYIGVIVLYNYMSHYILLYSYFFIFY